MWTVDGAGGGNSGDGISFPRDRLLRLPTGLPSPGVGLEAHLSCSVCGCSDILRLSQPFPATPHPNTYTCFMSLQSLGSEPPPAWLESIIIH